MIKKSDVVCFLFHHFHLTFTSTSNRVQKKWNHHTSSHFFVSSKSEKIDLLRRWSTAVANCAVFAAFAVLQFVCRLPNAFDLAVQFNGWLQLHLRLLVDEATCNLGENVVHYV